jgi:hypothetical protein
VSPKGGEAGGVKERRRASPAGLATVNSAFVGACSGSGGTNGRLAMKVVERGMGLRRAPEGRLAEVGVQEIGAARRHHGNPGRRTDVASAASRNEAPTAQVHPTEKPPQKPTRLHMADCKCRAVRARFVCRRLAEVAVVFLISGSRRSRQ